MYFPLSFATSHLPDSLRLKDVRNDAIQNSIVVEDVEIAVADDAGSARRDS